MTAIRAYIALALLTLALAAGVGGFWYGWSERGEKAQIELADAVGAARLEEMRLNERIDELDSKTQLEAKNAKLADDRYHAALRDGTIRLSIPTRGVSANSAAAGVDPKARAELDPAAAIRIDAIANDGDAAIRDLNACIDAYNGVRNELNKRK